MTGTYYGTQSGYHLTAATVSQFKQYTNCFKYKLVKLNASLSLVLLLAL